MRVCNLGSGSKGNCTFVETNSHHKFLIDAGLGYSDLCIRLALTKTAPEEIEAIFVSHEHVDHTKSLSYFTRKYHTKIYIHAKSKQALLLKDKKLCEEDIVMFFDSPFLYCGATITPIPLPHDSSYCSGFKVTDGEKSFAIVTDMGKTNDAIEDNLFDCSLLFVEANHNIKMLLANPKYPPVLKRRILSNFGHQNNDDCGNMIARLYKHGNLKQVFLAHLSEENNSPEVAFNDVCHVLESKGIIESKNIKIGVASQYQPTPIFNILAKTI